MRKQIRIGASERVAYAALLLLATATAGACRQLPPDTETARLGAHSCTSTPSLQYFGGPVVQNAKIRAVSWGTGVDSTASATLSQFYAAIVASPYLDWLSEYGTVGRDGQVDLQPGSEQAISRGTFAGTTTITPAQCAGPAACTITDAQIKAELAAQLTAGTLPAPTQGCDGENDTIYMLAFGPAVTFDKQGQGTCLPGCTYHGTASHAGKAFPYVVVADVSATGCAGLCGAATRALDNQTAVASRGLIDAITDPNFGLASAFDRPLGWYDVGCGEIGALCEGRQGTIAVGGTTWTVQRQWSNAAADCIVSKNVLPPICTGPGATAGCRSCGCADDQQGTPAPGQVGCGGGSRCDTDPNSAALGTCVSGSGDGGRDGGPDGNASQDAGQDPSRDAGPGADGGGGGGTADGGCGCAVGQLDRGAEGGLLALLALAALVRWHRRPASRSAA